MKKKPLKIFDNFQENILDMSSHIYHKNCFKRQNNIVCSISGGQDSIVLLIMLLHLNKILNLNIELIYSNHFWQKSNFYYFVELLKISYLVNRPISILVPTRKIDSENKGHNWRRKNFFRLGYFYNANTIVTGHTASDQIETAIWHLIRGTSPTGLISLKEKTFFKTSLLKIENKNFPKGSDSFNKFDQLTNNTIRYSTKKFYKTTPSLVCKTQFFSRPCLCMSSQQQSSNQNDIISGIPKLSGAQMFPKYQCIVDRKFFQSSPIKNKIHFYPISKVKKLRVLNYSFIKTNFTQFDIIRPLSTFHREDIGKIIQDNNLPIFVDYTNQSLVLSRNKIRLILIPLIRYYFTATFDLHLTKYLKIISKEQNYLNRTRKKILESYCNRPELVGSLFTLPVSLQIKCLQHLAEIYIVSQMTFPEFLQHICLK